MAADEVLEPGLAQGPAGEKTGRGPDAHRGGPRECAFDLAGPSGDQNGEHRFPRTTNTDFADVTDSTERAGRSLLCKSVKSEKSEKSVFAVPCCASSRFAANGRRAMTLTRRRPSRAAVVHGSLSQDFAYLLRDIAWSRWQHE